MEKLKCISSFVGWWTVGEGVTKWLIYSLHV